MAAAASNDVNAFDQALFSHIGHVGSSTMRSLWLGLTAGREFGNDQFVRLNFGCTRALLDEAVARLKRALAARL